MKDSISKLKFLVSLICLILVFIFSIAIYFVYNKSIEIERKRTTLGNNITEIKAENSKLHEELTDIESKISAYESNKEFNKEKSILLDKRDELEKEKSEIEIELENLNERKEDIKKQKEVLNNEKGKLDKRNTDLESENNRLKKEEEALKTDSDLKKNEELKLKREKINKKQREYNADRKEYDKKLKNFNADKNKFTTANDEINKRKKRWEKNIEKLEKDEAGFNKRFEEQNNLLILLKREKHSIETKLFSNDEKCKKLQNECSKLNEQILSLKKLNLIFSIFIFFLIILFVILLISVIKKIKMRKRQGAKPKEVFHDSYESRQINTYPVNSFSIQEEDAFQFEGSHEDDIEQKITDLCSQLQKANMNYGKICERVSKLEDRVSELEREKTKMGELSRKNNSFNSTTSIECNSSIEYKENKDVKYREKISPPDDAISDFYLSVSERDKRDGEDIMKYDKFLKIDEHFYSSVLDDQGGEHVATLVIGGEFKSAEFILIKDNLLYLNFYCYNENREFSKRNNDDIKLRRYIFDFIGDEYGRIIWCSPARVEKIENGKKYVVIEKGVVLIKNEI